MVSLKKGVLRITNEGDDLAKHLFEFCFALNLVTIFALYDVAAVAPVAAMMMFAASLFIWVGRKKKTVVIPYNTAWYTVFIIYNALTAIWASYVPAVFLGAIVKFLIILITVTSIAIYVDGPEELERILTLFIFSILINCCLELSAVPTASWFDGAMGTHFSNFNANEMGFLTECAEMMAFYKAYNKNNKKYYILFLFFMFFTILTSSRKATAVALIAPVLIVMLTTRKKNKFLTLIIMLLAVVGVGYLIMTNEQLYHVIGQRFNSMLNYYSEDTIRSDGSLATRNYFIEIAKGLFAESPILGKGMNTFANIVDLEYGLFKAYAHNNYWQVLSELGIIGFIIYYSMYAFLVIKLAKNIIINKSKISIIFLSFMVLLMLTEWGMVTVNSKTAQIIIAIAYTATYAGEIDGRQYKYIENNKNQMEE